MKTVILEQMYPERKMIGSLKYAENGLTMEQLTDKVYTDIHRRGYQLCKLYPEMTELRWEYEGYGQGHYIMFDAFSKELPFAWIGKLNYEQMVDVLKRAIELEDWIMAEDASYQLKLNQDSSMEQSFMEFELPYRYYKFDWMQTTEGKLEEVDDEETTVDINQMVPDVEPGDEYENLIEAVKRGEVEFESLGQRVTNPFYDETLRDEVDPIVYYGYNNLKSWL